MIDKKLLKASLLLMVGCLLVGASVLHAGKATPRKMNGTWFALVEMSGAPVPLPELLTFSTSGISIASNGFPPMPFDFDDFDPFMAVIKIGQGNWTFRAGKFKGTQLRFVTDLNTGMPIGYTKLIAEWYLLNRNAAEGSYRAEILQPDMSPYTIGGTPVVFEGAFEMFRLPIESLP